MRECRRTLALFGALAAIASAAPASAAAQLGIASFDLALSSTQAGAHADQTVSFALSSDALGNPTGQLQDATMTLPQGMLANAQAIPRCPLATFESYKCPPADQIGVLEPSFMVCRGAQQPLTAEALAGATTLAVADAAEFCPGEGAVTIGSGPTAEQAEVEYVETTTNTLILSSPLTHTHPAGEMVRHEAVWFSPSVPLFNLQPLPGHQASFGAGFLLANMLVNVNLPAGGGGGVQATIADASTLLGIKGATLTLWGVPSAASHDSLRCNPLYFTCDLPAGEAVPFTSSPTDCAAPLEGKLEVTSYEGETARASGTLPAMTGCEDLEASPKLAVAPDTAQRDTPAGYEIAVTVPQSTLPEGLATPALKEVAITLPAGTTLSPALATGLQACGGPQFIAEDCPDAAKLGTATLATPLLAEPLRGAVYLGEPSASEKYPLRVVLRGDGTSIRIAGHAELNPVTGQATTVFTNAPQFPFSELNLDLFGGPTAVFANPQACGPATSSATISSYAGQTFTPSSSFLVENDGDGGACPPTPGFAPRFTAGTTTPLAGEFSPLVLTVTRADGEPSLASFSAQLPPGLLGMLGSVVRCPEPQASRGNCPQGAQVGTATVLAGPGAQPLRLSGPVYLTGPYDGAPLGLATVIGAAAGPFNLGTMTVRSQILVNPSTLQLTLISGPFPQSIEGIPLRLQGLTVALNRPEFIVNPASCSPTTISATIVGSGGVEAPVAAPFRVVGCAAPSFATQLTASTKAGAGSAGDGAPLSVKIASPAPPTTPIRAASIRLPKQLRPRLSTLRHACLLGTAAASPSACPTEAQVGRATIRSPLLAAPLTGPVLLVAHGGAAAPTLALLLQAEGVSVDLTATLSLDEQGSSTATFTSLPDVPINSFELTLPAGPRSLLGAVANVCRRPLRMPYTLTAQSGAAITGAVRLKVSGCKRRSVGQASRQARRGRTSARQAAARQRSAPHA